MFFSIHKITSLSLFYPIPTYSAISFPYIRNFHSHIFFEIDVRGYSMTNSCDFQQFLVIEAAKGPNKKRSPLSRASSLFMKLDSIFFSEIRICSSGKRSKRRPDLHPGQHQLRIRIQRGGIRSSGGLRCRLRSRISVCQL